MTLTGRKRYDMKLGGAKHLVLAGYDGEKIRVRLASDTLSSLQNDFKNKIDVELIRKNGVTEAAAKEAVSVFVQILSPYIGKVELAVNAETVELHTLECDSVELEIKTRNVLLDDVIGTVEINCNLDMNVVCRSLKGEIALNQIAATSRICIPEGTVFTSVAKGIGTSISFERDGKPAEAFDSPGAENIIELNGLKSELRICTLPKEGPGQ